MFNFKSINSWTALEQNSKINIKSHFLTAYIIKHQILKNIQDCPPSTFCVSKHYLHPLVDFGFFLPKAGGLHMSSLFFTSVEDFKFKFSVKVRDVLMQKIKMNSKFSVILLPLSLKDCLPKSKGKKRQCPKRKHSNSKLESAYDSAFHVIRQEEIMEILKFIKTNVILAEGYSSGELNSKDGISYDASSR